MYIRIQKTGKPRILETFENKKSKSLIRVLMNDLYFSAKSIRVLNLDIVKF